MYATKSKNRKGEFRYYRCGQRQRLGAEGCANAFAVREDRLLAQLGHAVRDVVGDLDGVVREAMKLAGEQVGRTRNETVTVRQQIEQAVAEIGQGMDTIASPAQLHAFVERMIGPIRVNLDDTLVPISLQTTMASDKSEAIATSIIAGAGFEPATSGL